MPIYLMSIRVLLSVELCVTLKTYLKGAPFYNAWALGAAAEAELRSARTAGGVFSSMTSFTLRRERSERGSAIQDDMGKGGYSGTTGAFCGGGESAGEEFPGPL